MNTKPPKTAKSTQIPPKHLREAVLFTHLPEDEIRPLIDELGRDGIDDPTDLYMIFLRARQKGLYDQEDMQWSPPEKTIRLQCLARVDQRSADAALAHTATLREALDWLIECRWITVRRGKCAILQTHLDCSYETAFLAYVEWEMALDGIESMPAWSAGKTFI